jgi:predicted alpha/beta hydrolase family esterase
MTTIFSDDDPWVPYQENRELFVVKFNPEIITLHNKGHITADEGSTQLPELISLV